MNRSDRRLDRRTFLSLSLGAGAAAGLAACTPAQVAAPGATPGPGVTTAPAPSPVARRLATTFTLAQETINDSVDPHGTLSNSGFMAIRQAYDALLTFDEKGEKIVGQLAHEFRMINPTTMELRLRDDVKFANGEDFTAEVVKWNFERIRDTTDPLIVRRKTLFFNDGAWPEVEVVNSTTVRIRLPRVSAIFANRLTGMFMASPKFFRDNNGNIRDKAMGTGSFTVERFVPATRIEYRRYDRSWRGKNNLESATIVQIPEPATLISAIRTGEVDAGFLSASYELLTGLTELNVGRQSAGSCTVGVIIGGGDFRATADKRVRQALNLAVDKEAMLRGPFSGFGKVATGQLGQPGMLGYNENLRAYPYDPDRARALIREAGMQGEQVDVVCVASTRGWAEAITGYLNAVGLRSSVVVQEFAAFVNTLTRRSDFPVITSRTDYFSVRDVDPAYGQFAENPLRQSRFKNAEYERLYSESITELDPNRRAELLKRVAEIFRDEAPALMLVWQDFAYPHTKKIDKLPIYWDTAIYFWQVEKAA